MCEPAYYALQTIGEMRMEIGLKRKTKTNGSYNQGNHVARGDCEFPNGAETENSLSDGLLAHKSVVLHENTLISTGFSSSNTTMLLC